jgi:hypothetical protein
MEVLVVIAGIILLDVAAVHWGNDSRDGVDSAEWDRRHTWRAFWR